MPRPAPGADNGAVKIQLLSDLHLEVHPHFRPVPVPGADLLVLAGDVGSYQAGSQLLDSDFGLARFSPRHGWPTPVLYVPGNHEYDALPFDETHARLRETCARMGIDWLEREVHVRAGVRFVGTTLWADFDALNDTPEGGCADMTRVLQRREKAFRAANFYLRKTGAMRHGQALLAPQIREIALECMAWLRLALSLLPDRPWSSPTSRPRWPAPTRVMA